MAHDETRQKKLYIKPEITYEVELETRAGSPINGLFEPNPIDIFGNDESGE